MDSKKVEYWIAKSFDSNPKVRKEAALALSKFDDPGALLALLELAGDKDKEVAEVARKALNEKKEKDPEIKPLTELFEGVDFSGLPKDEDRERKQSIRKKLLEPIEKIMVKKLGKEKAEKVKVKLLPMIFKDVSSSTDKEDRLIGRDVVQTYLEVVSLEEPPIDQKTEVKVVQKDLGIEVIGKEGSVDLLAHEAKDVERDDLFTIEEKRLVETAEPSFFRLLYDILTTTEGDEKEMKRQYEKLRKYALYQVDLAYKLAKRKFKEMNLTDISKVKDGMRGIKTGLLKVVDVKHLEYPKTKKKKATYTRIVVVDEEGKEGVVYLFDDRGVYIQPGMKIRIEKGKAKTFKFSGETAITVDKRGKVIAEF